MFRSVRLSLFLMFCSFCFALSTVPAQEGSPAPEIGGEMLVFDMENNTVHLGSCPLKKTEVHATILGQVVRTTVRQTFANTFDRPVEAKYIFPLPAECAVDDMTMIVGDRRIVGEIHERQESQRIYQVAKSEGRTASLLNQERPNCFTQRIANIAPGEEIVIEISFLESVKLVEGTYEWTFPMVAGPRYVPNENGVVDTSRVIDAGEIVPPTLPPSVRAGHTISLSVDILSAAPVTNIESDLHAIDVVYSDRNSVRVSLARRDEIPNRDFILRYRTGGPSIQEGFFTYTDETGTYFSLLVQPPTRVAPEAVLPREVIFVIDSSGSMLGRPLNVAKAAMRKCIATLGPDDTFNLLAFASETQAAFEAPVPSTADNMRAARKFLDSLQSHGGTEMMPAVQAALGGKHDPNRLRIVCFMTDGYIGYEYELLSAIREHVDTSRVFSFGIGDGVNRFLLDQMARIGRGDVAYVPLDGDTQKAADRFLMRIHSPVLTDIDVDWGDLPVRDVTPATIPDIFTETPIMLHGRLDGDARDAVVTLVGQTANGAYRREITATEQSAGEDFSFIRKLWARSRIWDLRMSDLKAAQTRNLPTEVRNQIIKLSTTHRVLTEETAFVAVEKRVKVDPTTAMEIVVPVEMPQGLAATATNDWALLGAGLLLLLGGLSVLFMRRERRAVA
ncbi:VIT and VWA domain-containing protein [bacterium]|nr:VIT and VWA domain-containing protein [bacterium]